MLRGKTGLKVPPDDYTERGLLPLGNRFERGTLRCGDRNREGEYLWPPRLGAPFVPGDVERLA